MTLKSKGNTNKPTSVQQQTNTKPSDSWETEYGRFLADTDMDFWNKVCVIGAKVWKEQFKGQDPIGKEVSINNGRFTVIGIMESRGDGLEQGRKRR